VGISPDDPHVKAARARGLVTDGAAVDLARLLGEREKLANKVRAAHNRSFGQSAAELVALFCKSRGWPGPTPEYRFAPPRKWRFDVAWPARKVAVEFQGGLHARGRHQRADGFTGDCEKFSEAAVLGWRLLIVTYPQLNEGRLWGWLERIFDGE
jgi:hypothetical protein